MRRKLFVAIIVTLLIFYIYPPTYGQNSGLEQAAAFNQFNHFALGYTGGADVNFEYRQYQQYQPYYAKLTDSEPDLESPAKRIHELNPLDIISLVMSMQAAEDTSAYHSGDIIINPYKPMIAITFDDGPGANTERILDILERYNVRATFCVIGSRISGHEDIIRRTFESGHEIIGHSWSHPLYTHISRSEILRQLVYTNNEIYRVTGTRPTFHRPPYGALNYTVKSVSRELDMAILNWSVDPRDWAQGATASGIFDHIMATVFDGAILLFHDIHDVTVDAVQIIIPELILRGYQLVTASELLEHSENPVEAGVVYRQR